MPSLCLRRWRGWRMAKARSKVAQPARATRQTDPERWTRLFIVGGVVAVILIVVGIIGFGWYWTQIKPLGKTVLQVGETRFSLGHLERRMSLALAETPPLLQSREGLLALPDATLLRLEREAKLLEAADELNVSVSELEVDEEIRQRDALAAGAEGGPFAAVLRRQVAASGLKLNEYRQMIRAALLEGKVRAHFADLAPEREPQVSARWIVVRSDAEEQAQAALQRLEAGEEFAVVAGDLSVDSASAEQGGELGWRRRDAFPAEEIGEFLFAAQPGERSGIISTPDAFFILELLERDDARELDGGQRQLIAQRELDQWLRDLGATLAIVRDFTDEDADRALGDVL